MRTAGVPVRISNAAVRPTFFLVLNLSVQYTAGRSTGIFHAITALLVGLGFLGFGLTQTHNGKDGLADEVE